MISKTEYQQRRNTLMREMGPNSIAIIATNNEHTRTQDIHFPFRPDGNFYYLTGFSEPEAVAVLIPDAKKDKFVLFNRAHNPQQKIWHGHHAGQIGAKRDFLADESYPIEDLDLMLVELLKGKEKLFYQFDFANNLNVNIENCRTLLQPQIRSGLTIPTEYINVTSLINEMRLIKSEAELTILRQAATINTEAHIYAMKKCSPGMTEIQLSAELNYIYGQYNCLEMAYPPIVATGTNACTLHYLPSEQKLQTKELVLIDMGEEYQYYASDVTRTFPVDGKFSPAQRALYELVLHTQQTVIAAIKPGLVFTELQRLTIETITIGLVELGILQGDIQQLISEKAYIDFYMHRVSHWMGLDTHDVSNYSINGQARTLQMGMVLTVEPGIYVAADNENVATKWRGIGIRIEDDIVVTTTGHENLTSAAPKTVEEIEAIMASNVS